MDWLKFTIAILSGLATAIPLVVQLVKYVKAAVKEKNWTLLLEKVTELMKLAEEKFKTGAERKEWVMMTLFSLADSINFDIDYDTISNMIDSLCDLSKIINPPKQKAVTITND